MLMNNFAKHLVEWVQRLSNTGVPAGKAPASGAELGQPCSESSSVHGGAVPVLSTMECHPVKQILLGSGAQGAVIGGVLKTSGASVAVKVPHIMSSFIRDHVKAWELCSTSLASEVRP